MRVTLYPPIREQFEMASLAENYRRNLIAQFHGSEYSARKAHDDWQRQPSPQAMWEFANRITAIQTFSQLLPSERQLMAAKVDFE